MEKWNDLVFSVTQGRGLREGVQDLDLEEDKGIVLELEEVLTKFLEIFQEKYLELEEFQDLDLELWRM